MTGVVDTSIFSDTEGEVLDRVIVGNVTPGEAESVRRDIACGIELDRRLFEGVGTGVALGERFFRRLDKEKESASDAPDDDIKLFWRETSFDEADDTAFGLVLIDIVRDTRVDVGLGARTVSEAAVSDSPLADEAPIDPPDVVRDFCWN